MKNGDSITQWIHQLKEGERASVQRLWEIYFPRLVRQTQQWLRRTPRQAVDADDVALSAFDTFCRRAEQGQFPKLFDPDDFWQLLVIITFRKACNQARHEARRQPRSGRLYHASALSRLNSGDTRSIFSELIGHEPDPEFAIQAAEEYRRLLAKLNDRQLSEIVEMKMAGYTNAEIGLRLNPKRSVATVERKLARIRLLWKEEFTS